MSRFMLTPPRQVPGKTIEYTHPVLLTGSCFTEHIGHKMADMKLNVLQNPNGILFDPVSIAESIRSYIKPYFYSEKDLFQLNDLWHSWRHHSRFSTTDQQACLQQINEMQEQAHHFLGSAQWLIITLGTAWSYQLNHASGGVEPGKVVANCHKAPAQWFNKHLLAIEEIVTVLDNCLHHLFYFNPNIEVIFTVSPVRHIKDGIVENNRSKARLLESVHHLVNKFDRLHYFPAYELVVDVLRDYRFYEADLVHPNTMATNYVFEEFTAQWMSEQTRTIAAKVEKLVTAAQHKSFHMHSPAHQQFVQAQIKNIHELKAEYPFLHLDHELELFMRQLLKGNIAD